MKKSLSGYDLLSPSSTVADALKALVVVPRAIIVDPTTLRLMGMCA